MASPRAASGRSVRSAQRVGNTLTNEERLLTAWSPMSLKRELDRWFWPRRLDHIPVKKLWEDYLCRSIYFPRPRDRDVRPKAIAEGATTHDFFGNAIGATDSGVPVLMRGLHRCSAPILRKRGKWGKSVERPIPAA